MISGADKEITIFSKEGKLFQIGKNYFTKNTPSMPLRIPASPAWVFEAERVWL
jgi:hypothetical protein